MKQYIASLKGGDSILVKLSDQTVVTGTVRPRKSGNLDVEIPYRDGTKYVRFTAHGTPRWADPVAGIVKEENSC